MNIQTKKEGKFEKKKLGPHVTKKKKGLNYELVLAQRGYDICGNKNVSFF